MNLNFGGIVGGLVGLGVMVGLFALNEWKFQRGIVKLGMFAIFGGAAAGNFLWSTFFTAAKSEEVNPNAPPPPPPT
ncbi:hypothetical protein NA78x_001279 [Anatilimnocola sp. NA78]|uniref:hypothetical protein n=1 Tax=Anatilimnocola sp. NA78 TaxID=3415683 RepID=UPI003CE501B1